MRIKQKFVPTPDPIELFYPPKWKLNEKIRVGPMAHASTGRALAAAG
jgi:hypothetical protein